LEIEGANQKLTKILSSRTRLVKEYGNDIAMRVMVRLKDLAAADTLSDLGHLPPARVHLLKGKRKSQFAVVLKANWRLVFWGYDENDELSTDVHEVVRIKVKEVVDYHGE